MKIEFKNIPYYVKPGQVFFLYGNYKKTFDVTCEFIVSLLKRKSPNVQVKNCTFAEYEQEQNFSQCDLFGTKLSCYCIRKIEDKHLEKIKNLSRENSVFVLECGDFFKSKKVTEDLTKDPNVLAIASFNNKLTFISLCNMILPKLPAVIYNEIINIINETDEELLSLFKKLSLLLTDGSLDDLKDYIKDKKNFFDELDCIPFIRIALQSAIKENVLHQNQSYLKLNLKDKIHFLMDAEIKQKLDYPLNKNYIKKYL